MPLFICRWQNGDFSAVSARSRTEAIELLDEVGNAEVCELFTVKNFMVHFHLNEQVDDVDGIPVELEGFGEQMLDSLCKRLYPVYVEAVRAAVDEWLGDDLPREKVEAVLQKLNEALATERTRQWGVKEPEISDDPEAGSPSEGRT